MSMADIRTLKDISVPNKKVLVRVDYNVKIKDGKIKDDTRIRESIPTIEHLMKENAKIILMSHLGRPQEELQEGKGLDKVKAGSSLAPVAYHLGKLIGKKIILAPDCVGLAVNDILSKMKSGDIVMLENTRFHKEEEENDPSFARQLADLGDAYVLDGFGISHRANASSAQISLEMLKQNKQVAMGHLMEKELNLWQEARSKKGYKMLVVGGAKLEEKTRAVSKLSKSVDSVLIGGAVYNIIMAAKGLDVGDSLVKEKDKDYTLEGKELSKISNLILADKAVIAKKDFSDIKTIDINDGVPEGYIIADIVIDEKIKEKVGKAQVIIWFGNIGISDVKVGDRFPFAKGTEDFKNAINPAAYVIVGGGDSITASEGIKNKMISTGGGASIKLYTKGTLEGLEALKGNADYFKK